MNVRQEPRLRIEKSDESREKLRPESNGGKGEASADFVRTPWSGLEDGSRAQNEACEEAKKRKSRKKPRRAPNLEAAVNNA